jgi:hypothetical protein
LCPALQQYIITVTASHHYSITSLQHYIITAVQHYIITASQHYLLTLLLVGMAKNTFLHGQFTALERKAYYYFTIYYFFLPRVSPSPDGIQIF